MPIQSWLLPRTNHDAFQQKYSAIKITLSICKDHTLNATNKIWLKHKNQPSCNSSKMLCKSYVNDIMQSLSQSSKSNVIDCMRTCNILSLGEMLGLKMVPIFTPLFTNIFTSYLHVTSIPPPHHSIYLIIGL